jgi:hypothetical protein
MCKAVYALALSKKQSHYALRVLYKRLAFQSRAIGAQTEATDPVTGLCLTMLHLMIYPLIPFGHLCVQLLFMIATPPRGMLYKLAER